jgi:multiple sugar transport system permease protein
MLFVNATRSTVQIQQGVAFFPSVHFLDNYNGLMKNGFMLYRAFFNSLFVSLSSTVIAIYFSALTAFGFFAYNFKFKKALFNIILLIIMLPGQLGMIGFYQFMLQIGLTDSYIPLIVPAVASAGTVFFLTQYLRSSFPLELVEATRIDGAHEFMIFNRIVLPIMSPALATMAIFGVVGSWNSYVMPLILISSKDKYTMPMLIQLLKTNIYATDYGAMFLGLFFTMLPLIIIYLLLSKYIIRGVAMGGIKE